MHLIRPKKKCSPWTSSRVPMTWRVYVNNWHACPISIELHCSDKRTISSLVCCSYITQEWSRSFDGVNKTLCPKTRGKVTTGCGIYVRKRRQFWRPDCSSRPGAFLRTHDIHGKSEGKLNKSNACASIVLIVPCTNKSPTTTFSIRRRISTSLSCRTMVAVATRTPNSSTLITNLMCSVSTLQRFWIFLPIVFTNHFFLDPVWTEKSRPSRASFG